jgi:hypothetical protein
MATPRKHEWRAALAGLCLERGMGFRMTRYSDQNA